MFFPSVMLLSQVRSVSLVIVEEASSFPTNTSFMVHRECSLENQIENYPKISDMNVAGLSLQVDAQISITLCMLIALLNCTWD